MAVITLITLVDSCHLKLFKMEMKTFFDEENKLWKGEDIPLLYNPEISLGQALFKSFNVFGPKVAQV